MNGPPGWRETLLQELERLRRRVAELEANRPELVDGLLRDNAERQAAAQALLQGQEVLRQVLLDHDRQRQSLANEIDDALAQQLATAIAQLEDSRRLHQEGKTEAAEAFRRGLALVRDALEETLRLSGSLRSPPAETRLDRPTTSPGA
jgi:signal transduction histidine kinase